MTVSGEDVMAYVDGELDEAGRARVAQAARHDAVLAARIRAEQALRDRLATHFAPIVDDPVPPDWIASIRAATVAPAAGSNVLSMADARAARAKPAPPPHRRVWAGAAIAASLVVAAIVGDRIMAPATPGAGSNTMLASGELAHALDRQLASAQAGAPVQIMGTFKRQGGDICRVFAGGGASGIACHDGAGWHLQQTAPGVTTSQNAYRQAGSEQAGLIAQAQAMMAGDPFDATQERSARDHAWH